MHYVRPGAIRIGVLASDLSLHVLAFLQGSNVTTIIENTSSSAETVNLSALPPGSYGLSQSPSGASSFQELGIRTVGANGLLTITNLPGNSTVATLYPYPGTNEPPTIEVFGANPGFNQSTRRRSCHICQLQRCHNGGQWVDRRRHVCF
jgi:hypothetical protein